VDFYLELPAERSGPAKRRVTAGGLDVAGIEYLERNGRREKPRDFLNPDSELPRTVWTTTSTSGR
jgi:hypothetical protein